MGTQRTIYFILSPRHSPFCYQLLQEDIDAIRWEEDQARIAEEEAREMLAETRKAARAAREKNRKAEIERKKQVGNHNPKP